MGDGDVAWSAERTAAAVAPHLDRIRLGLLGRVRPHLGALAVADAAVGSGGLASSVMAPVWRAPDMSPALLLAELLTPVRFHRFDAHVEAWMAAGLTAEQVTSLAAGAERDAIEHETDRLAAVPYRVLAEGDRAALVHGLAQLPD